jgi:hypothetical protein
VELIFPDERMSDGLYDVYEETGLYMVKFGLGDSEYTSLSHVCLCSIPELTNRELQQAWESMVGVGSRIQV